MEVEIDMTLLTSDERRKLIKRRSYEKHKEEILAKMREKYEKEKEERLNAGIIPGRRGRPKKYPSDVEILAGR